MLGWDPVSVGPVQGGESGRRQEKALGGGVAGRHYRNINLGNRKSCFVFVPNKIALCVVRACGDPRGSAASTCSRQTVCSLQCLSVERSGNLTCNQQIYTLL